MMHSQKFVACGILGREEGVPPPPDETRPIIRRLLTLHSFSLLYTILCEWTPVKTELCVEVAHLSQQVFYILIRNRDYIREFERATANPWLRRSQYEILAQIILLGGWPGRSQAYDHNHERNLRPYHAWIQVIIRHQTLQVLQFNESLSFG